MNRIVILLSYAKHRQLIKIFSILSICFFLITPGCFSKKEASYSVSKEERKWLHKFFTDVFLEEGGIFVLFGSKPMMSTELYFLTQEEADEIAKLYYPEEEKNQTNTVEENLHENWEKWTQIKDRFSMKRYLLFAHVIDDDPRFQKLYLVDVLKTAQVLQEHYEHFRRFVGYDFDPFEMVFQIQTRENPFWKRILNEESTLYGFLMGYGEKNSWSFKWYSKCYLNEGKGLEYFPDVASASSDGSKNKRRTFEGKPAGIKHFPIPIFRSFSDSGKDEVVEKYKREREEIKKTLKKKDFVELILEKLSS